MVDIRTFHESLGSVDQDLLNLSISYIVEDGSEIRIKNIKDEINILKTKIDAIMEEIEYYKARLLVVKRTLEKLPQRDVDSSPSIKVVHSILSSYASALNNHIGDLRPDDLLEKKSNLSYRLEQLESRRNAAVAIQRMIGG